MRLFGLIGYPLSHSFSEKHFKEKFLKEQISDAEYRIFPLQSLDEFPGLIESRPDLAGLNVTIPYKEKIIPFLDEMDETAALVGAVNCIQFTRSGPTMETSGNKTRLRLKGYNTDVYGFAQSIKPFLEQHHQRALVLGTGGASKAVAYVLKQLGIEFYKVSRQPEKKSTRPGSSVIGYGDLNRSVIESFPLIINTTPLGTFPDIQQSPDIPYEYLGPGHFLYDLVYNPEETIFLKKGKEKGAMVMNGSDMLKLQADKAWKIFNIREWLL